jgi:hypothetical protein
MLTPVALHRRWRPYSWSHRPFLALPWAELADRYWQLADSAPELLSIIEIIDSVIAVRAEAALAANRTIGALNVVSVDAAEPPYAVVSVSVFPPGRSAPAMVQVEHVSCSGLAEVVVRPAEEAVPLFWRFVIEKFGIEPAVGGSFAGGTA